MSEPRLHLLFSPSAAGTLKQALRSADRPDDVLWLSDDFSFGPIATNDPETRVRWVAEKLGNTDWQGVTDETAAFLAAIEAATAPVTAWISRRETKTYAGFLWWLSYVGDMPVSIIEVPEVSSKNAQGLLEFLDDAVPLSAKDRMLHQGRWRQLQIEDAPLRVVSGEDLVSAPIDHFDDCLLGHATLEWQKTTRIVAGVLADFYDAGIYQAGDLVLGPRLADLAKAGTLEWRGDLSHMQRCELRLPANG
jgi:hypothetical protein